MAKIVISISGGCLLSVHTDIPNAEVEIFDWDNIRDEVPDADDADTHLEEREADFNQAIAGLEQVS